MAVAAYMRIMQTIGGMPKTPKRSLHREKGATDLSWRPLIGHVNGLGGLFLGADAAPVVGGGSVDVGVTGQGLNGDQITATVEQV